MIISVLISKEEEWRGFDKERIANAVTDDNTLDHKAFLKGWVLKCWTFKTVENLPYLDPFSEQSFLENVENTYMPTLTSQRQKKAL